MHEAAQDALRQLKERAAKVWQVAPEKVGFADGRFINNADSGATMTLKELGPRLGQTGGPVMGRGTVHAGPMGAPAFAGCLVDVEVDPTPAKSRFCAPAWPRMSAKPFIRAMSKGRCRVAPRRALAGR